MESSFEFDDDDCYDNHDIDPFVASNFTVSELCDPMLDGSEHLICAFLGFYSLGELSAWNIKTPEEEPHNGDQIIRECLCWKPLDVVKHSVAATTKLASQECVALALVPTF